MHTINRMVWLLLLCVVCVVYVCVVGVFEGVGRHQQTAADWPPAPPRKSPGRGLKTDVQTERPPPSSIQKGQRRKEGARPPRKRARARMRGGRAAEEERQFDGEEEGEASSTDFSLF
jgi:hypothetical protein